jgi:hypothetical protein
MTKYRISIVVRAVGAGVLAMGSKAASVLKTGAASAKGIGALLLGSGVAASSQYSTTSHTETENIHPRIIEPTSTNSRKEST